jgi:hypothetical protein
MEVVLKLNEEQANLIKKALDFYSRMHMGQFEEILHIPIKHANKEIEHCCGYRGGCEDYLIRALKKELTGMDGDYQGISSKDMPDYVRTCKDLCEVIRNGLAWYSNPKGDIYVDFDRPFHWNRKIPLATIEIKEKKA